MESFEWEAELCDGKKIQQFDNEGNETSFKHVQENSEKLVSFTIFNHAIRKEFKVNLLTGAFSINEEVINFFEDTNKIFRLIFFKRRRETWPSTQSELEYWLGWQTIQDGRNIKKLIRVFNEKVFLLEES